MNVLVIEASGLHLGYLGCYGNEWVATPNLDRLASQSVIFDQHYLDVLGSTATGRAPLPLPEETPSDSRLPTADTLLRSHDVQVMRIGKRTPFRESHDGTDDPFLRLADEAQAVLKKFKRSKCSLLWLHLPNLSPPWHAPDECREPYFFAGPSEEGEELPTPWFDPPVGPMPKFDELTWQRVQNSYASAVTYLDFHIGLLLEEVPDDVLLCFTADRGIALLEHGILGECRPWLHDELIHLPLLMRLPGSADAGRRVSALTQAADLAPTLLGAFGIPKAETHSGQDLLPLARGQIGESRPHVCTGIRQGERLEWAIRTPSCALILPVQQAFDDPVRPRQLYVKPDDRWEVNNLAHQQMELADSLEQTLRGFAASSNLQAVEKQPTS
jgi:arylsulfatase A-like enzyme